MNRIDNEELDRLIEEAVFENGPEIGFRRWKTKSGARSKRTGHSGAYSGVPEALFPPLLPWPRLWYGPQETGPGM